MAFNDFYIENTSGTASNLNGGTDTSGASTYTSTAGNFDGTSVFTPTDGQTTTTKVSVGDWVSLYNTGDTVVRCLAKVTVVGAGSNGTITIDTTNKFGTVPTSNSGSRACKKGGAWADLGVLANTAGQALAGLTLPASLSTRINIKAGTYANTTTSRDVRITAVETSSFWLRGFNATAGDLETDNTLTKPLITFTTGTMTISGAYGNYSGLSFLNTGAASPAMNISSSVSGAYNSFHRCRFESQNANAASSAFTTAAGFTALRSCWAKSTATSTNTIKFTTHACMCIGCHIEGGINGVNVGTSANIIGNLFNNNGTSGVLQNGANATGETSYIGNIFYSPASYGISVTTLPSHRTTVCNNIFSECGTNAINNGSGANTVYLDLCNNLYHSSGTPANSGLGDAPEPGLQTDSASPFTNSASSESRTTAVNNRDIGAWQSAGSGGLKTPAGFTGGMQRT